MAQKQPKGRGSGSSSTASAPTHISDARFAKFESDPRFRLPSKKDTRTKIDKRFGHVLKDKDFTATTQVDRYGRKLKSDKKKRALERLYEVEEEEKEEEGDDDDDDDDNDSEDGDEPAKADSGKSKSYDRARGGGFSASESDSDNSDDSDDSDDSDESDEGAAGVDTQQFREEEAVVPTGEVTRRLAIVNLDWDYVKSRDLMAMLSSFVPKDGRGRIERISVYPSEFGKERMQREELEGPPREIFKKKKDDSDSDSDSEDDSEDDEDDEDEDDEESEDDEKVKQDLLREEDDQDFDSNELRSYQLDRLRYFYAVMVCSDKETAEAIYRATDGREYQTSSNFLDLRFVPDDVSFDDDEPRDECTEIPTNYKPVDFITRALQHSKVKLTWDIHPEDSSRKDLMKKAFSGTPSELIENDLRAYLASDSDGDDDDGDDGEVFEGVQEAPTSGAGDNEEKPAVKLSKKELARQKMRAALGLGEEPEKSTGSSKKHGPVGGMQITFTPALSDDVAAKKTKAAAGVEETTIEKYKRKEKERKELRKKKAVAKREGRDPDAVEEDAGDQAGEGGAGGDDGEDLGFDDPFFFTEEPAAAAPAVSKTSIRKEERLKKRAEREAEAKQKEEARAQLEAIMGDELDGEGENNKMGHFDLREVMRAEKARKKEERRKNKTKRSRHDDAEDKEDGGDAGAAQTHLGVDVADPRLQAVFGGAEFAIDPSNPQYKDTLGLQQVLNEARRKRKGGESGEGDADDNDSAPAKAAKKAKTAKTATSDRSTELTNLVNSVKRKAKKNAVKP